MDAMSKTAGFVCERMAAPQEIVLRLVGNADMRAIGSLHEALAGLHAEAQRPTVREVTVDFQSLEFMNSSCFKVFATWLLDVRGLAGPARYTIRFLSDPRQHWQRRSLHALRCFAFDLVTLSA